MTESLQQQVDKLRFHVELLARSVDPNTNPVASLAIDYNWSSEDLDRAHDIFERYDVLLRTGKGVEAGRLEGDLKTELGLSYQDVKMVVLAFFRGGQWDSVCRAYAQSLEPSVPIELKALTAVPR